MVTRRQQMEPSLDQRAGARAIRFIRSFGSPRANFFFLGILVVLFFIGMIARQSYSNGFEHYYYRLPVNERRLLARLGFFDIYHSWYFLSALAASGLSILASCLNQFPTALESIRPRDARYLTDQPSGEHDVEVQVSGGAKVSAEVIGSAFQSHGFAPRILKYDEGLVVFGQRHAWNRFAPYAALMSIVVILTGFFLTAHYGVVGQMVLKPGSRVSALTATVMSAAGPASRLIPLPFEVECLGVRQQLINPQGSLEPSNTFDWITSINIRDGAKVVTKQIRVNGPASYRGYWFYQAAYRGLGDASQVTLSFKPVSGGTPTLVTVQRNGSAVVPGLGRVSFVRFFSDAALRGEDAVNLTDTYKNPAVKLRIETSDGKIEDGFAITDSAANTPEGAAGINGRNLFLAGRYKAVLKDYDRSATYHVISIDRDLGRTPTYAGLVLLIGSLAALLCFSHQRVWAVVTKIEGGSLVRFSGDANRHSSEFLSRFETLAEGAVRDLTRQRLMSRQDDEC